MIQKIHKRRKPDLFSMLFEGRHAFSLTFRLCIVLFFQTQKKRHPSEKLSSQDKYGQLGYYFQQYQCQVSVSISWGRVFLNIQLRQDSDCINDILVSMLHGILFYRPNDLNDAFAHYNFIADAGIPQRAKPVVSC